LARESFLSLYIIYKITKAQIGFNEQKTKMPLISNQSFEIRFIVWLSNIHLQAQQPHTKGGLSGIQTIKKLRKFPSKDNLALLKNLYMLKPKQPT